MKTRQKCPFVRKTKGRHSHFFFSGRAAQPGIPKCGACELIITSERGGGGLVLRTKISKFEGLKAKIWTKIKVVVAKIFHFFSKREGSCELTIAH